MSPEPTPAISASADRAQPSERYKLVRGASRTLCEPLCIEDYVVQSMPDASPTLWHLAHTTWFFETFVLKPHCPGYRPWSEGFEYLFNSYYNSVGPAFPGPRRGLLTRPTVRDVMRYRAYVDEHVLALLERGPPNVASVVELGLQHEQQHQELVLTDLKHLLWCNPLRPAYVDRTDGSLGSVVLEPRWCEAAGGVHAVGHTGAGFAYDNELPRHRCLLQPYRIAGEPVSCAAYMEFIAEDGYDRPEFWLADGWERIKREQWQAPLYWERRGREWWTFTLQGMQPVEPAAPVCHVSYFEADAYARFRGVRLPSEAEWEVVARPLEVCGNFVESRRLRTAAAPRLTVPSVTDPETRRTPRQLYGDVWEWTATPYQPYPGYQPVNGALGEYNGKFMCGQFVLRGGSCVTPSSHVRASYRNYWPPQTRWQFTGIRLAASVAT